MTTESTSILDVLIAIILIYALLSILVSILVEAYNHRTKSRGKLLKQAINGMLNDSINLQYGELFFSHHMISGTKSKELKRPPQYISSSMFADVLIDVIATQSSKTVSIEKGDVVDGEPEYRVTSNGNNTSNLEGVSPALQSFKMSLDQMADSPIRDMLDSFFLKADGDYGKLKDLLENWYNDQMDRVSGWYKTLQNHKFRIAGFLVAIILNVDSLFLIKVLSLNDELTSNLVNVAEGVADDYSQLSEDQKKSTAEQIKLFQNNLGDNNYSDTLVIAFDTASFNQYFKRADKLISKMDSLDSVKLDQGRAVLTLASELKLPIGWSDQYAPLSWFTEDKFEKMSIGGESLEKYLKDRNAEFSLKYGILYFIGIFISGMALSFGAPFWFEALVKLINVRRAGMKPKNKTKDQP